MASFQKRGKTWQYTVSNKGVPIRKGGFRTKKEAQIAAAEVEDQLNKGLYMKQNDILLSEYFDGWVRTYKSTVSKNTLSTYKNTSKTIEKIFEGKTIQSIDKRTYQDVLNTLGKKKTKETLKKFNGHIRACVRDAIDEGIIRVDFTRNVTINGLEGKKKSEKYLNYDDAQKLLEMIHSRLDRTMTYHLLLLSLTSGMRFAEIVGLTRNDFDFENNTINVDKTWGHTKNMHTGWGPTKNGVNRVIKMDKKTMNLFKNLFEETPDNPIGLVFYSPISKYKVLSNSVTNKVLKNVLNEIKIQLITTHNLRHTHVSILLYQGVSIHYISKRIGHINIQTTLNVYTHLIKELEEREEEKSINVLEELYV